MKISAYVTALSPGLDLASQSRFAAARHSLSPRVVADPPGTHIKIEREKENKSFFLFFFYKEDETATA